MKSREKKRRYLKEGWSYLNESWKYVWIAIGLFVLFSVVGFVFADKLGFIDEILRDLLEDVEGLSSFEMIVYILGNNAQSAFFAIIFGSLFGVVPILNAVFNGVVLGYVLEGVYGVAGIWEFWRLLPHGIFELPAIFISLGLGIKLGMFPFTRGDKWKEFKMRLVNSLVVFVSIILPLLIVAAVIEGVLIGIYG